VRVRVDDVLAGRVDDGDRDALRAVVLLDDQAIPLERLEVASDAPRLPAQRIGRRLDAFPRVIGRRRQNERVQA
jgi:hypothetical protein